MRSILLLATATALVGCATQPTQRSVSSEDPAPLIRKISRYIPNGYSVGDNGSKLIVSGEFTVETQRTSSGYSSVRDRVRDIAVVFEQNVPAPSASNPYPPAGERKVVIFAGRADGTVDPTPVLNLGAGGLVMSRDEGGMMGDPFQDFTAKETSRNDFGQPLEFMYYGGSADRWAYKLTLQRRQPTPASPAQFVMIGFESWAANVNFMDGGKLSVNPGTGGLWEQRYYAPEWEDLEVGARTYRVPNVCVHYDFSRPGEILRSLEPFCGLRGGQVLVGVTRTGSGPSARTSGGEVVTEAETSHSRDTGDQLAICRWADSPALRQRFQTPADQIGDFYEWSGGINRLAAQALTARNTKWKCTVREQKVLETPELLRRLIRGESIEALARLVQ